MKKARLILAGVAAFAIVGGVLATNASKAKVRGSQVFCTSTTTPTVALLPVPNATIATTGLKNTYCTIPGSGSTARVYTATTFQQ